MQQPVLSEADFCAASGYRLRRAIDAVGLSYVEAAEIMGYSKSNLGNWMRGDSPIRSYALYRLCRVTGITAEYVLLDDPSGLPARIAQRLLEPEPSPAPAG